MKPFKLPEGFLLGSATSATQIEGGDANNSWYDWCLKGKIMDGSSTLRADDHWNRYREDIKLLGELDQKVYRMGIEWSRVEPEKGVFSSSVMARYREEIKLVIENGIKPLITLHHFSNPRWFEAEGAFENEGSAEIFERYVRYVVSAIGDLVSDYVTINEPNVYVVDGYYFNLWPPGKSDFWLGMRVYINMARCHMAAYNAIHELRTGLKGETRVGVANHMRIFSPKNPKNPFDRFAAFLISYFFQDGATQLMIKGTTHFPFKLLVPRGLKGRYCDYIGINYYTRSLIDIFRLRESPTPGTPVTDLGWEIYPEGISTLCRQYYKRYHLPIWITENGACDNKDAFRAEFLCDHLEKICEAISKGTDVERYYHWSLLDNFEWLQGESARFGLVHVDYETQLRTVKKSGLLYAEICKKGGLTQEMIENYQNEGRETAEAAQLRESL